MGVIKRILKVVLGLLAGLLLLMALAVGAGVFMNDRAERRAAAFCDGVAPGSPVADAIERATLQEIRHYTLRETPGEVFLFPGWVFNMAECRVDVQGGVVTKKSVTEARD